MRYADDNFENTRLDRIGLDLIACAFSISLIHPLSTTLAPIRRASG
jgi:hypothetical protein